MKSDNHRRNRLAQIDYIYLVIVHASKLSQGLDSDVDFGFERCHSGHSEAYLEPAECCQHAVDRGDGAVETGGTVYYCLLLVLLRPYG